MEQITGIVGNRHDDSDLEQQVDEHGTAGTLETVRIEAGNRKRSRLRVETDHGTDLGIVLDESLRSGDVLAIDDSRVIVVEFERREAAVIDLPATTETAVELGHRIGNQHWDLAVDGGSIYIPVDADRHIIEDVLAKSLPKRMTVEYEEVNPGIWLDDNSTDGEHTHGEGGFEHSHDKGEHNHTGHVDYREATDRVSSGTGGDSR